MSSIAAGVVAMVALATGGVALASESAAALPKVEQFDGEELMRGIFFLQGEFGDVIAESGVVGDLTPNQQDQLLADTNHAKSTAAVDEIFAELEAADPTFFESFRDHVVEARPAALHDVLVTTLEQIAATDTIAAMETARSADARATYVPGAGAAPDCWVAVVVAAGVAIVVAAVAVVNLAMGVNWALGANVAAGVNVTYAQNLTTTRASVIGTDPATVELVSALAELR